MQPGVTLLTGLVLAGAASTVALARDDAPAFLQHATIAAPLTPETAAPQDQPLPPAEPPALTPAAVSADAASLRRAFAAEVPQRLRHTAANDLWWIERTKEALAEHAFAVSRAQLMVVVDRNPRVQQLRIILAAPEGGAPWQVIGASRVSTGQAGRKYYYITPTGVFLHTDAILDYRAEGTFNENHIRGLGLKGMRVWDFGWQNARKGWQGNGDSGDIRLLMHATDPDYLEQRLGRPASEGCVRIPDSVNRFLDLHGVLDADYERMAADDARYRALLLPHRKPTPLAGDALVIIDSSTPAAL